MTTAEIMAQLQKLGSEQTKKTLMRHGAKEPLFGVKVGDMKPIEKKVKRNHTLSLELYATGNGDAMYFAGLIADETKITPKDLDRWANEATWSMISEYTVPWIAAESGNGLTLGLKWIESKKESIASSGWCAIASYLALTPDEAIDQKLIEKLLLRVEKEIHSAPNRVCYCMNNFVIAVGSFVKPMSATAKQTAKRIGQITVDVGATSCTVPSALEYIAKVEARGKVGVKKKQVRC